MGTRWTQTVTCIDCGFKWKRQMFSCGDSDFEDAKVSSKNCEFCNHARKLGICLDGKKGTEK